MPWGKTDEEKQAERDARAKEEADQQAAWAQQQAAAEQAAADAAFASSPLGRAKAALDSGSRFFQVELEVSELTGASSMFGSSSNVVQHKGTATDVLGQIEDLGWHLEHAGYVFIETGSTSTNRVLLSGEGVVTQGNVTGIYLFRRAKA